MEFCIQCADCQGTNVLVGIKAVTTNSHSDTVDFRFVWMHSAKKIVVSDFAHCWLPWLDEKHCVDLKSLESPVEQHLNSFLTIFACLHQLEIVLIVSGRPVEVLKILPATFESCRSELSMCDGYGLENC